MYKSTYGYIYKSLILEILLIKEETYSLRDQAGQMSPSQQLPPSPGFQQMSENSCSYLKKKEI